MASPTGTASAPRSRISRRGLLATGALTAGALAAACAPGQSGTQSGSAPQASGRIVELRSHARAASEIDGYQKNVDAFNKQYEGKYKATYEPITGDLYQGQEVLMAGGTIGDVHYAHQSAIKFQEYAVKGAAVALDPYIAKDKNFKLTDWPQRAQDAYKIIDNKVYGLSVRGQVAWLFLYWNKDLLQKNSIPEPNPNWTLDEMLNHARRLQQQGSTDFYPVGYSWGSFETAVANVRRFGGEFFKETTGAGKTCTMDAPQCQQAIKWFYDNIKAGLFAPRTWGPAEFGQGKMAFFMGRLAGERGTVANAAQTSFQWTFDIVPKGPTGKRGGFLSIDTHQMNSTSKDKDGAWELLKWLTNKDSGVNLGLQPSGSLTPGFRKDVYCDDRLLTDPRFPKEAMKANCDNIDQPDSYVYPANFRLLQPGAVQEVLNKYLNDIADLKQEPTPAIMKQMTQEIQVVLDMPQL
ncbi:MAG TPA: extracellular solute-binding protein [Chloroflexota bacterium]|nr:extracellular solute-binding protein [Chloroflexota bacterium]